MTLFNDLLEQNGITTQDIKKTNILDDIGLNWTVQKEKLSLPDGSNSGFFGIVRQDNRNTFATCKDNYEPYQNSELLQLVNEAASNLGLNISKGGSFKGGGLVYLQLKTGNLTGIGENNDTVNKYITALNSHDGSCSLKWGIYNNVVSCSNQIWHLKKNLQNSVKHTTNMRTKIDEIMRSIELIQEEEKKLYDIYFKLAAAPVERKHIEETVKIALDIDLNASKKDLTSYQQNRLGDLSAAINQESSQKGKTLWGLFSGITKYTTHKIPGGTVNRQQSKAIGKAANIDNKVFNHLAELVTA